MPVHLKFRALLQRSQQVTALTRGSDYKCGGDSTFEVSFWTRLKLATVSTDTSTGKRLGTADHSVRTATITVADDLS